MKQQEYQEALDTLRRICLSIPALAQGEEMGFSEDFDFNHDGYEDECDTIQQLIDKLPYWLELEEKEVRLNKIEIELNNLHYIFHHGGRGELPKALSDLIFKIELDWSDEE